MSLLAKKGARQMAKHLFLVHLLLQHIWKAGELPIT